VRYAAAALSILACACGPAQPARPAPSAAVHVVVITPRPETLPFDPRGARLTAAAAEVARVAGHEIALVVDAALAEDARSGFEEQLIDAFERLARELSRLKETRPEIFAAEIPLFDRVACHYRALESQARANLDRAERTVHVIEPAHARFLPDGLLARALGDDFEAESARRFANVRPRDLPPNEQQAYFAFMTTAAQMNADRDLEARATRIGKLLELAGNKAVRAWLLSERRFFVDAYVHHEAEALRASDASAFRQVERAYCGWLVREFPAMSEEEKLATLRDVFVEGFNGRGYLPFAFPGIDKMGLALGVADAWVRAGHRESALFEYVVCPHPRNERGERSRAPRCDYHLYRFALADRDRTRRLLDAIVQKNDPLFAETAFVAVTYMRSGDAFANLVGIWRSLETQPATWTIAAKVIAEQLSATSDRRELYDEVRRQWRAHPDRRGVLLYVLAEADPYDNGAIAWKSFARDFEGPVTGPELASFLDQAPSALARTPTVWPALGAGFSRAAILVPRLDKSLGPTRESHGAVRGIVRRLCEEQRQGELAQIHAYFVDRVRRQPGESFGDVIDDTAPNACGGKSR
jgi:hypothetical protein